MAGGDLPGCFRDRPRDVSGLSFQVRFQRRVSTASASPANLGGVGQASEERTVAQTSSVNIDSPVAGARVGPVVYVSGTVSVVGSGPPFVRQVDRVTVQVGTGSQVTAQVTDPGLLTAANLCGTTSADTAFGRWRARTTPIDGELATVVDALTSSGGTLAGFDGVVQGQLSGPDVDFHHLVQERRGWGGHLIRSGRAGADRASVPIPGQCPRRVPRLHATGRRAARRRLGGGPGPEDRHGH